MWRPANGRRYRRSVKYGLLPTILQPVAYLSNLQKMSFLERKEHASVLQSLWYLLGNDMITDAATELTPVTIATCASGTCKPLGQRNIRIRFKKCAESLKLRLYLIMDSNYLMIRSVVKQSSLLCNPKSISEPRLWLTVPQISTVLREDKRHLLRVLKCRRASSLAYTAVNGIHSRDRLCNRKCRISEPVPMCHASVTIKDMVAHAGSPYLQ